MTTRPPHQYFDTRVRAKRIATPMLHVESRTLGSPMTYNLAMQNASRTGLLLEVGGHQNVPFQVNTIVELTLDPGKDVLASPVVCLAKIVRILRQRDSENRFGVHILQMESKDALNWEKVIKGAMKWGVVSFTPK